MRRLIVTSFATLDGVVQAPGGPGEAEAAPFNHATKYVASRTRPELTWQNSQLLEGDAASTIAELKDEDGPDLQVHGSGQLVQTLLGHHLVDELRLWTFPVVLGSGKRLFGDGTVPTTLRLVHSTVSTTGVVMAAYERDGEVTTGSFALA